MGHSSLKTYPIQLKNKWLMIPIIVKNISVSLNLTLVRNKKVKHYIR